VGQDERESGLRAILNFGHTFGHAIEAGLGYGAVAARRGGGLRHGDGGRPVGAARAGAGRVRRAHARLLERAGLPVRRPAAIGAERYLELMRVDKKAEGGEIRFVVIDAPGRALMRPAPDALVREVLRARRLSRGRCRCSRPGPAMRCARAAGASPSRQGCRARRRVSSATATASCTARRSGGWSTRRRCSSTTRATCSAPG
jgi:hypothetical protein